MTEMANQITAEIRAIRHGLAAKFENDLNRIVADLRRQQEGSARAYIDLPSRSPRVSQAAK
jgi:hypothetical protein